MKAGISTACFYPLETEKALFSLLDNGIKTTEIFFNSVSELEPAFVKNLSQAVSDSGARVVSIHPFTSMVESFLFFQKYPRRFQDGLDFYCRYFETAAALGAGFVVFHGDLQDRHGDPRDYYEKFARLREKGQEYGIILAQENVFRYCSAQPDFLRNMREYLQDEVEFTLDIKQCVREGVDVWEIYQAMGARLRHIHISDHGAQGVCLPVGKGTFNFSALIRQLYQDGYCGDMMLELYRDGYEHPRELYRSVADVQKMIDDTAVSFR